MAKTALSLRDSIATIARGLIDRERPKPRVCEVYSYNRATRFAEVLLPGEVTPGIQARFPKHLQPTKSKMDDGIGNATGDLVLVEGGVNNYRITQIIEGDATGFSWNLGDTTLLGGRLLDRKFARYFSRELNLPGLGNSIELGRFYWLDKAPDNSGRALTAYVDLVVQSIRSYAATKVYRFSIDYTVVTPTWQNLFPVEESGVRGGNEFSLEIYVPDEFGFQLRVRNNRENATTVKSGYACSMWLFGEDFYYDETTYNAEDAGFSPGVTFGASDVDPSEEVNGANVNQGPYFMPQSRIVHGRTWENLTAGGLVTWDDRYIKWTNNFVCAIGRSNLITTGVLQIPVPTVGQSIYYHGMSGASATIAYTSSGVDMMPVAATHSVLYFEPNFGSTDGSIGKFHVVGNDLNFKVPSHWIMIAVMNQNADYLKVANGLILYSWVNLTPAAGWAHSAYAGVANAQCRKVGNRVYFRGSLTSGANNLTAAATTVIAQVPSGYYNGTPRNYKAVGTTAGFLGWANVTDTGDFQVHFKTPYVTASGVVIDVSGMHYSLD